MEASPLTRDPAPEVFTPKIVQLYDALFKPHHGDDDDDDDEGSEQTEGFWREFFLLRPDRAALKVRLAGMRPGEVLLRENTTRELFARAVVALKEGREATQAHALETLSVFLSCVLSKRYPHPSSDVISVLVGLDHIDAVFTDFVGTLEALIRTGASLDVRFKAIHVLLAVTAGAYQTTLLTYMVQRDLFPSVMKFIQDSEAPVAVLEPFTLVGLLANYNKFEFRNPYQLRLNDFVNEATIRKIIRCIGYTCQGLRLEYVMIQDDLPEGWTLSSTLAMFGLGAVFSRARQDKKVAYDEDTARQMFTELPGENAALLLGTYDFAHANKLFCFSLVTTGPDGGEEPPIASYLSLTSYLLQHAHLSQRATHYAHLNLMVVRMLLEDPALCRRVCADESKTLVRLCRHRQPFLPLVRTDRVLAAALLDLTVDGINHNLRRRLDVGLYVLCVGVMLRLIAHMANTRTRVRYHWSELFRSLLSLVRFFTQYAADLRGLPHMDALLDQVTNLIALALSAGEAFLPTPAAYDDLFYKVVECGDVLLRFRDSYGLGARRANSIDTLVSVSAHYHEILGRDGGGRGGKLTAEQVGEVIKQGYETLSIQAKDGLDSWDRYREADERTLLKMMARAAVGDARTMVER